MKSYTVTFTLDDDIIKTKTFASSDMKAFALALKKFRRMYGDEGAICEVRVKED